MRRCHQMPDDGPTSCNAGGGALNGSDPRNGTERDRIRARPRWFPIAGILRRADGIGGIFFRTMVPSGSAGVEARGLLAGNAAAPHSDALTLFLHGNLKYTKLGRKK